ncbi:MAG: ABC transporter ATP-binding protein [Tissierellia bacterium]|nr:ABC transporter ATP-binding protein [Tissierellia bacterium]
MIYSIKNLNKDYDDKEILRDISFEIEDGEILSILGKNGAGKTTLIKILSNVLSKSSGEIYYRDKNLNDIGIDYYNEISVMLEGDRNIYWYLTGMENILYFGRLYNLSDRTIKNRAENLLENFGLYEFRNNKVSTYSRGMKQKLSLIIALINLPKVLFLDEPTLGLDVLTKNKLIDLLKQLIKTQKLTIILTSHEFDIVEKLSDKILILNNGEIEYFDETNKLMQLYSKNIYEITYKGDIIPFKNFDFNILSIMDNKNDIHIRVECNNEYEIMDLLSILYNYNYSVSKIVKDEISLEEIMLKIWEE